jgi:RNA polymerase sigma factor (sigma-70 family)
LKAESVNEAILWSALIKGDKDALSALYFRNYPVLYEYGMRLYTSEGTVEDCIHDLFLKLWNRHTHLRPVVNIRAYLLKAVRNELYRRIQQNMSRSNREAALSTELDMEFSVEATYIQEERHSLQARQVAEALHQLSARQKEVIYLRYFEDLSYEEIAAVMQVKVKAIYKLSARAHETLRNLLNISGASLTLLLLEFYILKK